MAKGESYGTDYSGCEDSPRIQDAFSDAPAVATNTRRAAGLLSRRYVGVSYRDSVASRRLRDTPATSSEEISHWSWGREEEGTRVAVMIVSSSLKTSRWTREPCTTIFSGPHRVPVPAEPQSERFAALRGQVKSFSKQEKGWDSYDAEAPSELAVELVLRVIGQLEKLEVEPDWIVPTSDESILLQFRHSRTLYKWEIESDGDIGIMIKPESGDPEYVDLESQQIEDFFAERCYEPL